MCGILTQDSISLTVSLNGVCFCYLETSSGKAGTIRWSTKHPACSHKSDPLIYPHQLWGKQIPMRWPCKSSSARCSAVWWSMSVLCHSHWTLSVSLRPETEAMRFPLWDGFVSSVCILLKLMLLSTLSTKHVNEALIRCRLSRKEDTWNKLNK